MILMATQRKAKENKLTSFREFSQLVVMCGCQEDLQPAQILHRCPPQVASVATRDDAVQYNWRELEALFSCCIVDFSYSCWQAPTTVEDKT